MSTPLPQAASPPAQETPSVLSSLSLIVPSHPFPNSLAKGADGDDDIIMQTWAPHADEWLRQPIAAADKRPSGGMFSRDSSPERPFKERKLDFESSAASSAAFSKKAQQKELIAALVGRKQPQSLEDPSSRPLPFHHMMTRGRGVAGMFTFDKHLNGHL